MKFIINNVAVCFTRLLYENNGGHILQLLLTDKGSTDELHTSIVNVLTKTNIGVMDEAENADDGQSEIRILQGLELSVIDQMRSAGMIVEQIHE